MYVLKTNTGVLSLAKPVYQAQQLDIMRIKRLNLSFILFLSIGNLTFSQAFLPDESSQNVSDLEQGFYEWVADKDLSKTKGWKWYGRWLEEQIQRSSATGVWPDQSALFHASLEVAKAKQQMTHRSGGAFVPVGPGEFPEVPGGSLFHGMGRINTVEFHPTDSSTYFVGVAQGGVWKTTDGGQSWQPLTDDLPIIRISDIAIDPSNTDILYICIGDYAYVGAGLHTDARKRNTHYGLGVYKSVDGGLTWFPTGLTFDQLDEDVSLMRKLFVHPQDGNRLVAVGISGVYTSEDGGSNWTKQLDAVMSDIERHPTNPNLLIAASHNVERLEFGHPGIWKSEDFGETWREVPSGILSDDAQRIELAIAPSSPDRMYALVCNTNGGFFGFYRSTDGGETWSLRSTQPNILHWYVGNNRSGQGLYDLALMVHPNDENIVYTGGINLWGTEDGGDTWKRGSFWLPDLGPSLHADHHYYDFNPLDGYFYTCHDGGINRTEQIDLYTIEETNQTGFAFTTDWEDVSAGMEITSFYRLDVSRIHASEHVIAGSQDNSTFLKKDTSWLNVMLGDGMDCLFHPTNPDIMYASTQGGNLGRSDDGGTTFYRGLTNSILETGAWTTPFEADPANPDGLYTAFGNVYHSDDRGETWEQLTDVPSLPGSQYIVPASTLTIAPSDPDRFYYAQRIYPTLGVTGKVWTSPDHGATVEDITDGLPDSLFVTASAVSDINSEFVWLTFGGFADGLKVFRSVDAGQTWKNVSYNLPNIPINAIEFVPESTTNEIYIGTDVGIYMINDVLDEWQLFSDGLPNVIVTDLYIDEMEEVIYASTFGRGIWKGDLAVVSSVGQLAHMEGEIELLPNPNNGQFTLEFSDVTPGNMDLEVFDVQGRRLFVSSIEIHSENESVQLNPELRPGLYFLKLNQLGLSRVIKFSVW